ncbi:HlyD family secretion protein [Spirosoma aerolatum]|uniref:HlyD family secretion protein n=1 Tax=Spirosoma aerolatum TaxID=1211326 RepID=UPI0014738F05|nr:HlyD family efflux transporter periplasmic adaptor subunit [Spirosoma aerolatum]
MPYTIATNGLVMPTSEWTLSRAQNGNLISTVKDNRTGQLSSFSTSVFQRGYQANFQLSPSLYDKPTIQKGDTVASLYSNQDQERLMQLQGDLAVQEAELLLHNSGHKLADVEKIAGQMALAKEELEAQRKLTNRTEALYKDSLTSTQEYETALNKLRIRELTVNMTEADYKSAITGSKPEEIQVTQRRIGALQQQIQQIKNGLKDLTLLSPVSGTILFKKASLNPTEEVLVSVADNSGFIVVLPVNYLEREYVQIDQEVAVDITGTTQTVLGKISSIDNTIQLVDGRQAFFVTALIAEKNVPLVPGMLVKATIQSQPISIKEHIIRVGKLFLIH